MSRGLTKSIILLPGMALVIIPGLILLASYVWGYPPNIAAPGDVRFWLALLAASMGISLAAWSVMLLIEHGQGTPAPWEPPNKLVVRGVYRYVRNPMIGGALFIILAEALFFGSWPLVAWMLIFLVFNLYYFPFVEEVELEKRFGANYIEYKTHVPRWLPRLRPWKGPGIDE
jgi:protein-S-isoprenylcysteine O-methyltransferase Ste14